MSSLNRAANNFIFFFIYVHQVSTPKGVGGGGGGVRRISSEEGGVGGGGVVLQISSDEDDRRVFWGLKFSIPGFFG